MITPIDFITNKEQFLIVNGPAGTGKTSLISHLINECKKLDIKYDAVAYTGKAASNLRNKCNGTGRTIHNFLYSFEPKPKEDEEGYLRGWKIDFEELDILFVDECSMISSDVRGHNVDGENTYLFKELLYAVQTSKIKKIMLLGDTHQLPPIYKETKTKVKNEDDEIMYPTRDKDETLFPDSLNDLYIRSEFQLTGDSISLENNWRYKEDLPSYKLSLELRQDITRKKTFITSPKKWIVPKVEKNKLTSNEEKIIEWVIDRGGNETFNNVRILTFTNEKADEWNRKVRKTIGKIDKDTGEVENISIDEPMMNLINKEYSKFYNGDSFVITELIDSPFALQGDSDCEEHVSCKKRSNRPSELFVQKANILLFNEDKKEEKIVNLVNRGVVANDEKTKDAYNHRVWCDFATRNSELYKNREESLESFEKWNDTRNNDEIYATGIACYAYASTVHKTQGDSFEYVVIDLEDEDKNLKWLYTALTRTNKDFILFGKKSLTDWF